jgi:hypothetical protein
MTWRERLKILRCRMTKLLAAVTGNQAASEDADAREQLVRARASARKPVMP